MNVLLVLAFALQDETAREEYGKIVRSIEQAKTLKIVFQGEAVARGKEEQKLKYAGKVLLKDENKAVWEMNLPGRGNPVDIQLVSDGAQTLFSYYKFARSRVPRPASPRLRSTFNQALSGLGIFHSCAELAAESAASLLPVGVLNQDEVFDLKMIERVKKSATLVYKVKRKGHSRVGDFVLDPQDIDVKLTYESDTYRLQSRMLSFRTADGREVTLTETYSSFLIGDAIPDSAFKTE